MTQSNKNLHQNLELYFNVGAETKRSPSALMRSILHKRHCRPDNPVVVQGRLSTFSWPETSFFCLCTRRSSRPTSSRTPKAATFHPICSPIPVIPGDPPSLSLPHPFLSCRGRLLSPIADTPPTQPACADEMQTRLEGESGPEASLPWSL